MICLQCWRWSSVTPLSAPSQEKDSTALVTGELLWFSAEHDNSARPVRPLLRHSQRQKCKAPTQAKPLRVRPSNRKTHQAMHMQDRNRALAWHRVKSLPLVANLGLLLTLDQTCRERLAGHARAGVTLFSACGDKLKLFGYNRE